MRIIYTTQFKKDYKKIKKQKKDINKLKEIIEKIVSGKTLGIKYRDHQLSGIFKGYRDCHIDPDWLLIYKKTTVSLVLERTGSHSELFKK